MSREQLGRPRTKPPYPNHQRAARLERSLPGVVNLNVAVKEWQEDVVFLHKIVPGSADKSYGIHVARLAGIPEPVLRQAEALLDTMTAEDAHALAPERLPDALSFSVAADSAIPSHQLSLFTDGERDALEGLRGLDLETLSPLDAFLWLARIKKQL